MLQKTIDSIQSLEPERKLQEMNSVQNHVLPKIDSIQSLEPERKLQEMNSVQNHVLPKQEEKHEPDNKDSFIHLPIDIKTVIFSYLNKKICRPFEKHARI
ncbi:MAG: hypothetical protein HWD61_15835 [Parachlamydiaceae bacterium]|nr:MAG: hypothetical protein HWD61_15835 [Parachlamydiaceae bacterium]